MTTRVAVLNNYLGTFGGGEKNTYAVAHTLSRLGYAVDVVTFEERAPAPAEVADFFGPGHDGFRIVSLWEPGLDAAGRDRVLERYLAPVTVFVNQCNSSTFVNPCPLGVYMVMFPFQDAGAWVASYQHYLCNSRFTEFYVKLRWGGHLATSVLYPPVDEPPADPDAPRAREVLSIGRFTWEGHAKNQDVLVDAFSRVFERLPEGWTLTLVGKVHDDAATLARLEELRAAARHLPVRFELNAPALRKGEALRRAAVYWHGTGVGRVEPGDAARMEHFGISVVEAMASGAVPMCYHRGGAREIVRHAESGFLYRDVDELGDYLALVAGSRALEVRLRRAAIERSRLFSRERFDAQLAAFVSRVVVA